MLASIQYRILKRISPGDPSVCGGGAYQNKSKLAVLLGDEFLRRIRQKTVIDFGCAVYFSMIIRSQSLRD